MVLSFQVFLHRDEATKRPTVWTASQNSVEMGCEQIGCGEKALEGRGKIWLRKV